ncbi:aminoglycoside phosphotransferase family protein [Brachybacterium endophyticum]|uniref:Aminoglycoside phosphotransferase family protein n=1 Tax=Brachybacterium endophyticum TaxID=2182385 RepID=A0A2U2RJG3_9MICO|nr:aminoglycoside phosphotransferase family protein [Brachybacterium endophyticum]PWH06017.1 aminoglycoside phosphotransferase family protein [Brachybacterium endophyticum]
MTSRSSPSPPFVASDDMGDRIRRAWREGALLPPPREGGREHRRSGPPEQPRLTSADGEAQVQLLGTGETFAAWHLSAPDGAELMVRIPWHAPAHPLSDEIAALAQVPAGVGPRPVALHESAEASPLGVPYLVTTPIAGRILMPGAWDRPHLLAHADRLAQLHRVTTPGRGPVALGADPWERMSAARLSLPELFAADTQHVDAAVLDLAGGPALLHAAERALRASDPAFADLEGFVLSHGDLCATNIVWQGTPTASLPGYIDFEWAMGDDPARDLAIIGGSVHGGPWYVPLGGEDLDAFVDRYLGARTQPEDAPAPPRVEGRAQLSPAPVLDPAGLRSRRDAWEVYEKTAMLLHVAGRVRDETVEECADDAGTTTPYRRALPVLQSTLAARLGGEA